MLLGENISQNGGIRTANVCCKGELASATFHKKSEEQKWRTEERQKMNTQFSLT